MTERAFLHELSTPLMVALAHAKKLAEDPPSGCTANELERLKKISTAVLKMIALLETRRQSIHSAEVPTTLL
jgi:division protein CdvB (Snf7/Vps24/ESCRT-III family)